jgi:hypothetical protein
MRAYTVRYKFKISTSLMTIYIVPTSYKNVTLLIRDNLLHK